MAAPQIRRGSPSADVDYDIAEEEEYYVTRPHTSVRRYQQPSQRDTMDDYAPEQRAFLQRRRVSSLPPASSSFTSRAIDPQPVLLHKSQKHSPWLALIIGMLCMITLVMGFTSFSSWWQTHQNDVTYGRPRTYQTNAAVGHHDSASNPSHFIFINLNRHLVIVEFPGGDATHAITYPGPTLFGDGSDLVPVTGEFKDVNGDGKPDMLVHIENQTIVYLNNGTKFLPPQSSEQITI